MDESRNSTFDEELLARCAYALGYDLARALAVMGDAFARGLAGGFADMAAPAGGGVELVQEDTDEETYTKTEIKDCRACWCDACAKLEDCQQRRGRRKAGRHTPLSLHWLFERYAVQAAGRSTMRRIRRGRRL